jgi:hypothetical protein
MTEKYYASTDCTMCVVQGCSGACNTPVLEIEISDEGRKQIERINEAQKRKGRPEVTTGLDYLEYCMGDDF